MASYRRSPPKINCIRADRAVDPQSESLQSHSEPPASHATEVPAPVAPDSKKRKRRTAAHREPEPQEEPEMVAVRGEPGEGAEEEDGGRQAVKRANARIAKQLMGYLEQARDTEPSYTLAEMEHVQREMLRKAGQGIMIAAGAGLAVGFFAGWWVFSKEVVRESLEAAAELA